MAKLTHNGYVDSRKNQNLPVQISGDARGSYSGPGHLIDATRGKVQILGAILYAPAHQISTVVSAERAGISRRGALAYAASEFAPERVTVQAPAAR